MKRLNGLPLLMPFLMLMSISVLGQDRFYLTFRGTCWTTEASGRMTGHSVTEQAWLADYAETHGIQNAKSLAAVYHVNGDDRGDVIEVIDKKSGTVLDSLFGLFFGQSYDRMALTNSDGTMIKNIEYVYNHQIDHSVGSALVSSQFPSSKASKRTTIQGQMDYLVLPDNSHSTLQVCNGTFVTGKPATLSSGQQTQNAPSAATGP